MDGWTIYDPFLLGFGPFSGAFAVSFRQGYFNPINDLIDKVTGVITYIRGFGGRFSIFDFLFFEPQKVGEFS